MPPLVVPETGDDAGLLAAEFTGALVAAGALVVAGALLVAGAGEAAGADASVGLGLGFDGGGAPGEEGVPKPGDVHAQARLTPATAAQSTERKVMEITRARLDI